jgi:DNA-binding MarR family transcriptional regulator
MQRLERQGLVERRRIPDDRRVVRIELTARGRRLAARLCDPHVDSFFRAFELPSQAALLACSSASQQTVCFPTCSMASRL